MNYENRYFGLILTITVILTATAVSYGVFSNIYDPMISEEETIIMEMEDIEEIFPSDRSDIFTMSLGIGLAMGLITLAVWEGGRKIKNDAANLLLDEGLENMTVKDLVIVRRLIEKKKFTIPELTVDSPVTRSSVWRLVKRLNDKGLVEEIEDSEVSDGTRGKPRKVFRYVGPKGN